jgi:DNA-binding response OmpR family regulator
MKRRDALRDELVVAKILLVSDDLETGRIWSYSLQQKGWQSILIGSTEEAWAFWGQDRFDLIVIDVRKDLPNGLELCRRFRTEAVIPILLLTVEGDEAHILEAYQAGVSECVVKPVSPAMFLAKVQAWLRFSWTVLAETLDCLREGDFSLDPTRRGIVTAQGVFVKLSNLEFRVLYLLMSHRGQVLETDVIVDRVWGHYAADGAVLLKNVIYRLRQKLEPDPAHPRYIVTVSGIGYLFQSE